MKRPGKAEKKLLRYSRIRQQLSEILLNTDDKLARMATIAAVLHHKMYGFFWTGYYFLRNNKLVVGPYQGPVACMELEQGKGVCWTSVQQNKTILVEDVDKFPGHIACDGRSKSEIVVPVRNENNKIVAVLDIDSNIYSNFNDIDTRELERIIAMVFS